MTQRPLLAVLALATLARVLTYVQIHDGPALHLHVWGQSDMSFFDRWAHAIAAGDVLTRADMRPYHGWQRDLACEAITLSSPLPPHCHDAAVAKVWDGWVGRGTFWQDPGYPYLLALLYRTVGDGVGSVYALHALAGIACTWLVYSITAALFGAAAAIVAGVAAALYGPLIFFETLRLREVAITLVSLAAVRIAMTADSSGRTLHWLLAGVAAGLSILLKASALLYAVVLLAVIGWRHRQRPAIAARTGAAFAAGVLIAFSPLVARNLTVGISPFSVASTGPLNFLNGNAADYTPGPGTPVSRHALAILTKTGGRAHEVIDATLDTHPTRAHWLVLLGRKLMTFWRAAEIPDNANYRYFLLQAPWLRFAVGFGLVAPLAILGFAAGLRRWRWSWIALLNVAATVAVCVLFFNLSRFRLPAAVGMLPFAGFALVWLVQSVRERAFARVVAALALAFAAAAYVNARGFSELSEIRIADYGVHNAITLELSKTREASGDVEGAVRIVDRQLATEPAALRAIEPSEVATSIPRTLSGIAGTFSPLHEQAARLYGLLGEPTKATLHGHRAAVLARLNAPYAAERSAAKRP